MVWTERTHQSTGVRWISVQEICCERNHLVGVKVLRAVCLGRFSTVLSMLSHSLYLTGFLIPQPVWDFKIKRQVLLSQNRS